MKPIANNNNHITSFLRQIRSKEDPNEIKIIFQDKECFPDIEKRRHFLRFDKDYSKSEFINANKNYRGYKEDDEVNEWLT